MPHSEHSVRVSVREIPAAAGPPGFALAACELRLDLQGLQRFGSFLNCLSRKKSCSPAVKMNSPPQSAQVKSRSTNSIPFLPSYGKTDRSRRCTLADVDQPNFDQVNRGPCRGEGDLFGLPAKSSKSNHCRCLLPWGGGGRLGDLRRPPALFQERRPSKVIRNRASPVPCESSCGSAYEQALLSHASSRRASDRRNDA